MTDDKRPGKGRGRGADKSPDKGTDKGPEDREHPKGMPPKGESETAWEDQGSIVERLKSPSRETVSKGGRAGTERAARASDAEQRKEETARQLEGRGATDARSTVARSVVARRADEMRGLTEIEEAQRIVLDEPIPEQLTPDAERRAARQVAAWFTLGGLASLGFLVVYSTTSAHKGLRSQNALLGLTMGIALLAIGVAAVLWVKKVMPHEEAVQVREPLHPSPEERRAMELDWARGVEESGVTRRKVLLGSMGASTGLLALTPLFLLRDLGPSPVGGAGTSVLDYTAWRPNLRFLEYDTQRAVKLGDVAVGSLLTIVPEGHVDAAADSAVMLIRLDPSSIVQSTFDSYAAKWKGKGYQGSDFVVDGHVAYSKICTHAGCPVSLFERQLQQFLCPCHQSTFVATEAGKVIFGPAARPLPMLPFMIDDQGYFRAKGDFPEPVGPSFWERG